MLKPLLSHGKVTFSVASLTVLGSRVPLSALGRAGSGLSGAFGARDSYPLGLAVASLTVTPDGVRITLNGGRSTLKGS